jgi:C-terminal processing protease CtpA/Prc
VSVASEPDVVLAASRKEELLMLRQNSFRFSARDHQNGASKDAVPLDLVVQVWNLVREKFAFSAPLVDWGEYKPKRAKRIETMLQAKDAIRAMLSQLHDPWTRYEGPEREQERTEDLLAMPTIPYIVTAEKFGYLRIPSFTSAFGSLLLHSAVRNLEEAGVKGYILDLSGNLGGKLILACEAYSMFARKGEFLRLHNENTGTVKRWFVEDNQIAEYLGEQQTLHYERWYPQVVSDNKPIVALVDSETASASECLLLAFRDSQPDRITVVGATPTFGKCEGQSSHELIDGGMLILTSSFAKSPRGLCIDRGGLIPDVLVESADKEAILAEARALLANRT